MNEDDLLDRLGAHSMQVALDILDDPLSAEEILDGLSVEEVKHVLAGLEAFVKQRNDHGYE